MKVPWGDREWNKVVVFGLGASGMAATRLLRSRGVEVLGVDRQPVADLELGELHDDAGFAAVVDADQATVPEDVDGMVISPGVSPSQPLVLATRAAGLPVIAEVELASCLAVGPLIGITGSNGKSTTTRMTGEILGAAGLEVEVCGNIGVPLSAVVEGPVGRVFVTELSSFQLESIDTFHPRAAALLNLSPDHLDRHLDDEHYVAAKMRLFRNQEPADVAVLNADDERVAQVQVDARQRHFSRRGTVADGCYLDGDIVVEVEPGGARQALFECGDLSLPGVHNLENAMAAALLSRAMGADPQVIPGALRRFQGLPHRLQEVADRQGVVWYDDSKATNFAATQKSLLGFAAGSVHLILGGQNKGGDPAALIEEVSQKVLRLYLIGEAAAEIEDVLGGIVPCESSGTLEAAVAAAAREANSGEAVLLSPSCASFDQYRSFIERGQHFQTLVRSLDG